MHPAARNQLNYDPSEAMKANHCGPTRCEQDCGRDPTRTTCTYARGSGLFNHILLLQMEAGERHQTRRDRMMLQRPIESSSI
jgi:hypothetical protein